MTDDSSTFLAAIRLTPAEPASGSDAAFTAMPQPVPWPKAYGGDIVAQSAAAAAATVPEQTRIHSMHGYFARPVDVGVEVRYDVETLRDGRSFSLRTVRGYQNDALVATTTASFHVPEEGEDVASEMPAGIPDPESLPSAAEVLAGIETPAADYWSHGRSFDMRHVPSPVYLPGDRDHEPHQAVWVKAFEMLPDDAVTQAIGLAYVCDYTILEPILRASGYAWADPGLVTASLDHAMWFHRPGRIDEWVLYAQEAASAQDGRGLATGRFFDRGGRLLATVAQEGVIRPARI